MTGEAAELAGLRHLRRLHITCHTGGVYLRAPAVVVCDQRKKVQNPEKNRESLAWGYMGVKGGYSGRRFYVALTWGESHH